MSDRALALQPASGRRARETERPAAADLLSSQRAQSTWPSSPIIKPYPHRCPAASQHQRAALCAATQRDPRRPAGGATRPPRRARKRHLQHSAVAAGPQRRSLGGQAGALAGSCSSGVPCSAVCVEPSVLGLRGHAARQVRCSV